MGFGVLFIGYFIYAIGGLAFPEIATFTGFAVMSIALLSLAEYDKRFAYTLIPAAPAAIISFILTVGVLLEYFGIKAPVFISWVGTHSEALLEGLKLVYHVMLCYSIYGIASDTGAEKVIFPAKRNMCLYTLCYLGNLSASLFPAAASYILPIVTIVYLVTIILNHVMIFTSYMYICDEKDVDMEIKETKIKWLDRLIKKNADLEQKAADDTRAYFQAKYDKKIQSTAESNRAPKKHKKKSKKK